MGKVRAIKLPTMNYKFFFYISNFCELPKMVEYGSIQWTFYKSRFFGGQAGREFKFLVLSPKAGRLVTFAKVLVKTQVDIFFINR